ncbi:hypothetical protein IAQ61_003072 [Plenodomus lingam]|uniref:Similar to actin-related protein RO7 n=1 Tax=Leptosphaeria maculans (strain JN3 / isolate v23.1.3 / race Av1-4-5-6-7-8) TaxID=985895 RepID=E5ADG3_LEPMJ|nr:similar to actin-related protein RO7 [Plenodomus lingam JN3]KAH9875608.1 hypothetical protein IAQ61_003072 [Plenodomus lingam]CBY01252.1 similar to actin-related protein RO7 [Plenodomus lingam JN3]
MSTSTGGERKVSGPLGRSARPRIADLGSTPETPRTPLLRSFSSTFGSPGGSFRTEDEYVAIEVGARFVRGGFPGESSPRCTLSFGPDSQRRVGDYRQWDPEYVHKRPRRKRGQAWGQDHELYRMHLPSADLGLVEDKFERAMREAHNKYFLLDTKPRRILLAMPSRTPHPLLATMLDVLFTSFQAPSVTLMSNPVLCTVAAGLRSALVIDIGWAETVVTAVCEFREVLERRTVRAGRMLSERMAKLLNAHLDEDAEPGAPRADVSFEEAEEVLTRVAWCKSRPRSNRRTVYFPAREAPVLEEFEDAIESPPPTVTIPFPKHTPPTELRVPFASLAQPAEDALFASDMALSEFDDEDLPLHHLVYRTLVQLPIDVRRLCMSRLVITGGVSNLPGLKTRILKELEALAQLNSWNPVKNYGTASARHEEKLRAQRDAFELRQQEGGHACPPTDSNAASQATPAGFHSPDEDAIDLKLANLTLKNGPPSMCSAGGMIRGVESLGAWAGASLVAQQRIKGIVEIERERYLKDGLQGSSREKEVSVVAQRQSMGAGLAAKGNERASWTLGIWA